MSFVTGILRGSSFAHELNQTCMADETERSATDNIKELAQASETMLKAGKQLKDNLNELGERVENVTERTSDFVRSPWFALTVAAGISLVGWQMLRAKS